VLKKNTLRIGVIGGVNATLVVLKCLSNNSFKNVKVWGYKPKKVVHVSGLIDLSKFSLESNFEYESFTKVTEIKNSVKNFLPDILFVVGLSQIVPDEIVNSPKFFSIGFHPTKLPTGRGRAPFAWMILDSIKQGAATFFKLGKGIDDGPIINQIEFNIKKDDYVYDLEEKMLKAEYIALDEILNDPKFPNNSINIQNNKIASYYGLRNYKDGTIDWHDSSKDILKLIRASSKPHPGAFTFFENYKISIFKAKKLNLKIKGVVGKILLIEKKSFVVQSGEDLIKVINWEEESNTWNPKVGMQLGYQVQNEIYELKKNLQILNNKIKNKKDSNNNE